MAKREMKSRCRNCGERVHFGKPTPKEGERPRYYDLWIHTDTGDNLCAGDPDAFRKFARPKDFCCEQVETWNKTFCNRPVKAESGEDGLCGIHLRFKRDREQQHDDWNSTRELSNYNFENCTELAMELKEKYGIASQITYNQQAGMYDGFVKVNPRELLDFMEAIFGED